MNINISTRLESINENTKEYALTKVKKLERFYNKIIKMDVVMNTEGEQYKVEIVITPDKGPKIVSTACAEEWLAAIDNASDKAERQLRKLKEKTKSHRIKKAKIGREERSDRDEETYDDVVGEMKGS